MNIFALVTAAPYWVWPIFGFLLFSGFKAAKGAVSSIWQLGLTPLVFIFWSMYSIYNKCENCYQLMAFWAAALVIGLGVSYFIFRKVKYTIQGGTELIHSPKSFIPLILSMIFFGVKYAIGAASSHPIMAASFLLKIFDASFSGLFSGIFSGRFLNILKTYVRG